MNAATCSPSQLQRIVADLQEIRARAPSADRTELANEIGAVAAALQALVPVADEDTLLTTGDAASMLGVRSVNTIKRWARQGLLEGYRRGGRVLVSRRSVDRLRQSPTVAAEREYEQGLREALDAFDFGDAPCSPTSLTAAGRKPWSDCGSARS
jgi:excisionase family DNA binding protein